MAQPLRSLSPQIKDAPLVVPTRRVKFVRVEVVKASLLIRTTTVHYIIGVAWSNVRSLWVISGQSADIGTQPRNVRYVPKADSCTAAKASIRPPHRRSPGRQMGWSTQASWRFSGSSE